MFPHGIDYGTHSVRALVVRCLDVVNFRSGRQSVLLDPKDHNLARKQTKRT